MARTLRTGGFLLAYPGLVVWLTWPLAAHLATHLPDTWRGCRFDPLLLGWAWAHQARALVTGPWHLGDADIYHPTPGALFYGESGPGAVPYFAPVFLATGNPTLAVNTTILGCVALTAAALHFVVLRWTRSHLAGFLAAWTFLTTRFVLWTWIPVSPNYAALQYLPLIILLAAASAPGPLLPLFIVLQGLASPYLAAATAAPLLVLALARLVRRSTRGAGLRLLAIVALGLGILLIVDLPYLRVRLENPGLASQTVWRDVTARPTPLPWGLLAPDAATAIPTTALVLIVAGALALAVRRVRGAAPSGSDHAWAHGALWVVVGVVASLTPIVTWQGRAVQLPQLALAHWAPIYEVIRFPHRLAVAALMGLAILVGLAFSECTRRLRSPLARALLALLVSAVMYGEYSTGGRFPGVFPLSSLPRSYPLWKPPAADSPLLALLERSAGPVLEVPIGPVHGDDSSTDAPLQARAMYRSIFHRRPVLNGYSGYWPAAFPERMALVRRLPDPDALAALHDQTGLETILVQTALFGAVERELCATLARAGKTALRCREDVGAPERSAWLELAARGGRDDIRLIARDGDALLFAVTAAQARGPAPPVSTPGG